MANYLDQEDSGPSEELQVFTFGITSAKTTPIRCEVLIDRKPITMEVDTVAAVSLMSEHMRKLHFPDSKLSKTNA